MQGQPRRGARAPPPQEVRESRAVHVRRQVPTGRPRESPRQTQLRARRAGRFRPPDRWRARDPRESPCGQHAKRMGEPARRCDPRVMARRRVARRCDRRVMAPRQAAGSCGRRGHLPSTASSAARAMPQTLMPEHGPDGRRSAAPWCGRCDRSPRRCVPHVARRLLRSRGERNGRRPQCAWLYAPHVDRQRPRQSYDPSLRGRLRRSYDPSPHGRPYQSYDPSPHGRPYQSYDPSPHGRPYRSYDPWRHGPPYR